MLTGVRTRQPASRQMEFRTGNAGRYQAVVIQREAAGAGSRVRILDWEKGAAQTHELTLDPQVT